QSEVWSYILVGEIDIRADRVILSVAQVDNCIQRSLLVQQFPGGLDFQEAVVGISRYARISELPRIHRDVVSLDGRIDVSSGPVIPIALAGQAYLCLACHVQAVRDRVTEP